MIGDSFNSTSLESDCRSFVSGELGGDYLSAGANDEDLFDLESKMSLWLIDEAFRGRTTQYLRNVFSFMLIFNYSLAQNSE